MAGAGQTEKQLFVEEVGIVFEQTGLPRMAGRIFGWLLIADPPQQNTDQIARGLLASKGSISTTTRFLIQHGLIERVSLPGVRHDFFRLKSAAKDRMVEMGIVDEVKMFRQLTERGLEIVGDKDSPSRHALEEMHELYLFLEQELPALRERWFKRRNKIRKTVKK
jgi:DNA-binding transcriptional regulator GbsR (MarR family)